MLHNIDVDQKEVVFYVGSWPPGYFGEMRLLVELQKKKKKALDKEPTDDLMPFSDLKPKISEKLLSFFESRKEDSSR